MTPPLETLPLTILEDICGYLAQCDGFKKRRSLWAFSLTNRWCCAAAAAQRFSQIQLTVSGPDKLKADLQCWTNILTMHNRFRHVRRLNVVGPVEENNSVKKQPDAPVGGQEGREEDTYDGLDDVDDVDDFNYYFTDIRDYFDMHDFCKPSKTSFDHPAQGISEDTEGWQPLAHFIRQLPALQDLVWTGAGMPPYLLSAIHDINCRLHMHRFQLPSLIQTRDSPQPIDPDEYALATSPCLNTILVGIRSFEDTGEVNFIQEAVLRMVAGAAPGLAHIWMRPSRAGNSIALLRAIQTPKPVWRGFFPGTIVIDEPRRGALRSLVTDLYPNIGKWNRLTDFTKLRCLTVKWAELDQIAAVLSSLQTVADLAMQRQFESLHTLDLSVPEYTGPQMQALLATFLGNLRPLRRLEWSGFITNETFDRALQRHGRTLLKLRVFQYRDIESRRPMLDFSGAVMERLAEECLNLEELDIPVERTRGDRRETEIYQSLSRVPRLKHLSLRLRFPVGPIPEDKEDEDEDEEGGEDETPYYQSPEDVPAVYLRDAFANCAIDSALAFSIFNMIASGGSLSYLNLKMTGYVNGHAWYENCFSNFLTWLAPEWLCTRDVRGKVVVRQRNERSVAEAGVELSFYEQDTEEGSTNGIFREVWHDVWPQSASDWWNHWKSLPLSECSA